VPDEARGRETTRTFRATLVALEAELGVVALVIASALAVGLAVWAVVDLAAARAGYLDFALFHAYVEFAAAALFLIEGRRH
jgi:uncharacterized membrane protein